MFYYTDGIYDKKVPSKVKKMGEDASIAWVSRFEIQYEANQRKDIANPIKKTFEQTNQYFQQMKRLIDFEHQGISNDSS